MNSRKKILIMCVCIIIMLILNSCVTQKRCNDKFPPSVTEVFSSVTKDSIVSIHDTVKIHGATAFLRDTIPCPELTFNKSVRSGHATVSVNIDRGIINASANCDSLQKIVDSYKHYVTTTNTHTKTEKPKPETIEVSAWYDIALRWISLLMLIIILVLSALLKIKK